MARFIWKNPRCMLFLFVYLAAPFAAYISFYLVAVVGKEFIGGSRNVDPESLAAMAAIFFGIGVIPILYKTIRSYHRCANLPPNRVSST